MSNIDTELAPGVCPFCGSDKAGRGPHLTAHRKAGDVLDAHVEVFQETPGEWVYRVITPYGYIKGPKFTDKGNMSKSRGVFGSKGAALGEASLYIEFLSGVDVEPVDDGYHNANRELIDKLLLRTPAGYFAIAPSRGSVARYHIAGGCSASSVIYSDVEYFETEPDLAERFGITLCKTCKKSLEPSKVEQILIDYFGLVPIDIPEQDAKRFIDHLTENGYRITKAPTQRSDAA